MAAARILQILSPHRLISSRLTPRRCFLKAPNATRPCESPRTALYPPTVVYPPAAVRCTSHISSLSAIFPAARSTVYGGCGLKNINPVVYSTYIQRSGVSSGVLSTLTAAQSAAACRSCIHTTGRRNVLLPPHIWLFIKPVQKLLAIILGRSVRKWWKSLPANKRQLFRDSVRRNKWRLSAAAGALGVIIILFYFTNLEEAPITGRSRLLVFKKKDYELLTNVEYECLMEEYKDVMLPATDRRYRLVQKIVDRLVDCNRDLTELSTIQWVVHVVDIPEVINAFVLSNGQVFVFTGMLRAVADNHQLSFILGHELAHAILQHTAEMASVTHFLDFLFLISLAMIWAICPMDSLAIVGQWIQSRLREFVFERPYNRTLEAEADKVGLELAAKACVDVRASAVFWKQMDVIDTLTGQIRVPEWLSTHPSHGNRAEQLERLIPKAVKLRESCNCPDLPSVDPRLVFELTMKDLLQNHKDSENKVISGAVRPLRVDDRVAITAAVRGA